MSSFYLAMVLIPLATLVIGWVYLVQYETGAPLRQLLVALHFLAVTTIIISYFVLCMVHNRPTGWQYPGWAFFLLGSGLFWFAVARHASCLVPDERIGLISTTPYCHMRHPIYTGGLLGALGLVGVAPTWEMVVLWVNLFVCLWVLAIREERELMERLGSTYREYCRRTKRLVPWVL